MSLDGKIARPDGSFDWLEPYPPQEFGIEPFLAGVDAIVMGRATLAGELEGRECRRVWVEGGGQVIRGMIAAGKLDVLEMAVLPLVLGEGIPLFPAGTPGLGLRLIKCERRTGGALHVVYEATR